MSTAGLGWASATESAQPSGDTSETTEHKEHTHTLAASTETGKCETMSKFKAFLVRREIGKRGVIDNSLLPGKADVFKPYLKISFYVQVTQGMKAVFGPVSDRQEFKSPQLSDPPVP